MSEITRKMLEPSSSEDEGDGGVSSIPSSRRRFSRDENTCAHPVASTGHSPKSDIISGVVNSSTVQQQQQVHLQSNTTSSSSYQVPSSSTCLTSNAQRTTSPGSVTSQEPSINTQSSNTFQSYGSNDRLQATTIASSSTSPSAGARPGSSSCNRPVSPTPSMTSDSKESSKWDESEREESERKTRLQLYVFVIRCISYPFNAKQPNDISRRNLRLQRQQLEQIQSRVHSYLKDEAPKTGVEDHFYTTVEMFYATVLTTDRLLLLVKGGGCSLHDLKEIFRLEAKKRVKSLPDPEGSTKEGLINSWMGKFECLMRGDDDCKNTKTPRFQMNLTPDSILTKDQLYDMFQGVIQIKKFEHQLLFKYEYKSIHDS